MISTYGLTHVALAVKDAKRSFEFYRDLFGVVAVYQDESSIQAQTPGSRDVLVFEENPVKAGRTGGVAHFGFRLVEPGGITDALRDLERLGVEIVSQGEFSPGQPFVFFRDPDGYEIEVWFEPATAVDPVPNKALKRTRRKRRAA